MYLCSQLSWFHPQACSDIDIIDNDISTNSKQTFMHEAHSLIRETLQTLESIIEHCEALMEN